MEHALETPPTTWPAIEWMTANELSSYEADFASHFRLNRGGAIQNTRHQFRWQAILDQLGNVPGGTLHGLYFTYGLEGGGFVPVVELVLATGGNGHEVVSGNAFIHSETGSVPVTETRRQELVRSYLANVKVTRLNGQRPEALRSNGPMPDPCGLWYPLAEKIDILLGNAPDPNELLVVSCISAECTYTDLMPKAAAEEEEYRHFLALSMGARVDGGIVLRSIGENDLRVAFTAMDLGNACPPNCPPRRP